MKTLHADFLDDDKPVAYCVKVENPRLNVVLASPTSWDEKVTFGGVTYNPQHGGQFETIDSETGAVVPQTSWYGILGTLTPTQLRHFWRGAVQTHFRIVPIQQADGTWIGDPTPGADIRFFGDLASLNLLDDVHFQAEFRDLMARVLSDLNYHVSVTKCQHKYGEMRGNIGCAAVIPTYDKTILSHSGLEIEIAGTPPRLLRGRFEFLEGANEGFEPIRIVEVVTGGGNTTVTLAFAPPFTIMDDIAVRLYGGCLHDPAACVENMPASGGKPAGWGYGGHDTTPTQTKLNVVG